MSNDRARRLECSSLVNYEGCSSAWRSDRLPERERDRRRDRRRDGSERAVERCSKERRQLHLVAHRSLSDVHLRMEITVDQEWLIFSIRGVDVWEDLKGFLSFSGLSLPSYPSLPSSSPTSSSSHFFPFMSALRNFARSSAPAVRNLAPASNAIARPSPNVSLQDQFYRSPQINNQHLYSISIPQARVRLQHLQRMICLFQRTSILLQPSSSLCGP